MDGTTKKKRIRVCHRKHLAKERQKITHKASIYVTLNLSHSQVDIQRIGPMTGSV